MKTKKRLVGAVIIISLLLLCIATAATVIKTYTDRGFVFSKGTLYIKDGTVYLIDGDSATVVSDCTKNKDLFEKFENGNRVLLLHDGIETTLPSRTGGYFILLLSSGDSSFAPNVKLLGEKKENSDPKKSERLDFKAHYVRTDGGFDEGNDYPQKVIVKTKDELLAYYEKNKDTYWLGRKSDLYEGARDDGFLDVCDLYDEAFFTKKALLMVLLEEGSGSVRHRVDCALLRYDGILEVSISALVPEAGTDDMALWHVMIELDRNLLPDKTDDVEVIYNNPLYLDTSKNEEGLGAFSFSFRWGTYGQSFYDSRSGKLIKTKDSTHPEDYVTECFLSEKELQGIYDMIQYLDMKSYPDEYNPHGNAVSTPYMSLELSVRDGNFEKTVTVPETALSYDAKSEKGQRFLDVCRYIEDIICATNEWKALPDYEFLYD